MSNITSSSSEVLERAVDGTVRMTSTTPHHPHFQQPSQPHTANESSPLLSSSSSSSLHYHHHATDPKKMKRLFLSDNDRILIQVRLLCVLRGEAPMSLSLQNRT